jgi:hypothetical protein
MLRELVEAVRAEIDPSVAIRREDDVESCFE